MAIAIGLQNDGSLLNTTGGLLLAIGAALALSGPTTVRAGTTSNAYTVSASLLTSPIVVTRSDGGRGGLFTPATLTLTAGQPSGTFTYRAAAAGSISFIATNSGTLDNPMPFAVTATSQTYAVNGPSTGAQNYPIGPFTVQVSGTLLGAARVYLSDGGRGGSFLATDSSTITSVLLSAGDNPYQRFYYQAAATGSVALSFTNNASLPNAGALTLTVTEAELPRLGTITTPEERTIKLKKTQTGDLVFAQQADPRYITNWCFDYSEFLDEDETLASIDRDFIGAIGLALGMTIGRGIYRVTIDGPNKKLEWYLIGDPDFAEASAFAGTVDIAATFAIITTAVPPRRYENTGITKATQK